MKLNKVPGFVSRVMWVGLITSAALLILNYVIAGLVCASIVFAANLALKREPVKLWVFRVLTGMSKEELERATLADAQAGGSASDRGTRDPDDPPAS
ncbi:MULTISPECIES: hypothetical protein [Roseovarius]|jgi:hypothetical protein|uniref:hypothetical protein n=1 Tax=Roseovarius TaxID=74030 RepID=UPI000CDD2E8B|nr:MULTISPECIES: hypothetical protein [Roseovarius]